MAARFELFLKCPHCSHEHSVVVELATVQTLGLHCPECHALFVVEQRITVRESLRVGFLGFGELLPVRQAAQKLVRQIAALARTEAGQQGLLPEVACPGCKQTFGGLSGYPGTLPKRGMCSVCSQEVARRDGLAKRRAS